MDINLILHVLLAFSWSWCWALWFRPYATLTEWYLNFNLSYFAQFSDHCFFFSFKNLSWEVCDNITAASIVYAPQMDYLWLAITHETLWSMWKFIAFIISVCLITLLRDLITSLFSFSMCVSLLSCLLRTVLPNGL